MLIVLAIFLLGTGYAIVSCFRTGKIEYVLWPLLLFPRQDRRTPAYRYYDRQAQPRAYWAGMVIMGVMFVAAALVMLRDLGL